MDQTQKERGIIMKLQIAYDTLALFLNTHNAGLAEQEALKSLAAYCKGIETKAGNPSALNLSPIQSYQPSRPAAAPKPALSQQPAPNSGAVHRRPSFAYPAKPPAPQAPVQQTGDQPKGKPWSKKEENDLVREYNDGLSACDIAAAHRRTVEAIAARLKKLGVIKNRWDLHGYDDYRKACGTPFAHD